MDTDGAKAQRERGHLFAIYRRSCLQQLPIAEAGEFCLKAREFSWLFTDEDRKIEDKKMKKNGRKILRQENGIQKLPATQFSCLQLRLHFPVSNFPVLDFASVSMRVHPWF
ncbi:MAG: hypothetical protein C5B50_22970 [Verrucomicrobia bacterium]|nr:MAG: hypothetical protein C5B50_22970 [Verrucomicrobiota bacterium]